jgi:hypothetical protein
VAAARKAVDVYPWVDAVVPVVADPEPDYRLAAKVRAYVEQGRPDYARAVIRERGWYYRVHAPRLGEPLSQMSCGRGTGHYGSGLYFFGTFDAALQTAQGVLEEVYRVVGGPKNPYRVGAAEDEPTAWEASWKLHKFGKALLCLPAAEEDRLELTREIRTADEDDYSVYDTRDALRDLVREIGRFQATLKYAGPRLDTNLHRAEAAIQRAVVEGRYHPMTYYMRSLGYDGIIHTSWRQFTTGGIGNIWYPEV